MTAITPEVLRTLHQLVVRRPFRRSRVDDETSQDIRNKLQRVTEEQGPISFSVPFGGYKAPQLLHSPHLNWAEVFWLDYLRSYAQPLADLYAGGVVFSFSYMSGVLAVINQIPETQQRCYINELQQLMSSASCNKIRFELVDLAEAFGGSANALQAVQQRYSEFLHYWPVSIEAEQQKLASAKRNLPVELQHNSEEVRKSAMLCDAMESLELRRQFNKFSHRIQLTHVRGGSLSVHMGSCRGSVMQPWVGYGIVDKGVHRIVSDIALPDLAVVETDHLAKIDTKLQKMITGHPSPALTTLYLIQDAV